MTFTTLDDLYKSAEEDLRRGLVKNEDSRVDKDAVVLTDLFHRLYDCTTRPIPNEEELLQPLIEKGWVERVADKDEESDARMIDWRDEAIKALIEFRYETAAERLRQIRQEMFMRERFTLTIEGLEVVKGALGDSILH
jgi:hypothetical protein